MTNNKKMQLTLGQQFWLMVSLLFLVAGLALAILGFLRDFLPLSYEQNWIRIAESAMNEFLSTNFSWQIWGSLLMITGAVIFALLMQRLASEEEKQLEKLQRRAQRLQDAKIAE